jgi:thiopurine S-methyltransferase
MQPEFWHERWRTGQIGFHQATVDASLERLWPMLGIAEGRRIFVPLCGKSLDLVWLRNRGHPVVGVELSAAAVEAFFLENGIPARRRPRVGFDAYEAPGFEILRGDYFELTPEHLRDVGAVYDRAALISWTPELRDAYARHLLALAAPGTQMLLITLEYPQAEAAGPPFAVMPDEIDRLYSPHFEVREVSRRDILPTEPRLRHKGITQLFEVCYHLTRKLDGN